MILLPMKGGLNNILYFYKCLYLNVVCVFLPVSVDQWVEDSQVPLNGDGDGHEDAAG